MGLFKQLLDSISTFVFPSDSTRRVTLRNPLVIESPRIGFLNLMASDAEVIMREDKAALGPLFSSVEESDDDPPACEVLMVYCRLEGDGSVGGHSDGLRDIIRKSRAPVVIVAVENTGASYRAAAKPAGGAYANLVMTLDRKGAAFTDFFIKLFRKMFEGKSMLVAWHELAPQIPGREHENAPDTYCAAEITHIIFRRA